MDLFNSYRDPFLYGEEEEEGEVGGIADDDDPQNPAPDPDLVPDTDPEKEEFETTDWKQER
jgi:hypothetical protein